MTGRSPLSMPMQWNTLPIPLGVAGIDTRSDPKAIQPPALARLENAVFSTPGAIVKRPGSTRLSSTIVGQQGSGSRGETAISGAKGIVRFGDRLLMETDTDLLAYSEAMDRWTPIGPAPGIQVAYEPGAGTVGSLATMASHDMAYADGLLVTAWETTDLINADAALWLSVRSDSGAEEFFSLGAFRRPRLVAVGDAILLFALTALGTQLRVYVIQRSALATWAKTGPAAITLATNLNGDLLYDVASSGGRVLLVYSASTADLKYGYVTVDGALDGALSSEVPAAAPTDVTCCVEPTTRRFALLWTITSANDSRARVFAEDKTALFAAATMGGATGLGAINANITGFRGIVGAFESATLLHVFTELDAASASNHAVRHSVISDAGVQGFLDGSAEAMWFRHSGLASKPWLYAGRPHVILVHESPVQSTYFVGRGTSPAPVDLLGGNGDFIAYSQLRDLAVIGCLFPGEAAGVWAHTILPSMVDLGDGTFRYPARVRTRLGDAAVEALERLSDVILDHVRPAQWTDVGDSLIGTGGLTWQTDGRHVAELGFLLWAEGITATASVGSGSLTEGTYLYRVYRERTWPDGRREQSTAVEIEVVLTGSQNTVDLQIPSLSHSNWSPGLQMVRGNSYGIYRSLVNETVCHRVSEITETLNGTDPSVNGYLFDWHSEPLSDYAGYVGTGSTSTFEDRLSDAAIEDNEIDYLSSETAEGNVELENIAAPGCDLIASGNNRVFLAGLEDASEIRVSKTRGSGEPLTFSTLATAADMGDGPITALGTIGDMLIAFREHEIYLIGGEGPDNFNTHGQFTEARTLSSDLGCISPRSVVRIPMGLLFQSRKGFYLQAGDQLSYIGAAVERYKDEEVVAAVALPDKHEVRFILASGTTLLYDYLAGQWATWTAGGVGGCVWQRQFCRLVDDTGLVLVEDADVFTDDGASYTMLLETPWIRLAALQGSQRVRKAMWIGEYRGQSKPRIWVAYDGVETWRGPYEWHAKDVLGTETYGEGSPYGTGVYGAGSSLFQFELRLPRQKCQSVKFKIEDVADGAPLGEGFRLTEMALEVGARRSPARIESTRRAG